MALSLQDINAYNGEQPAEQLPFPIIADKDRELALKLGMLDPDELDKDGMPLTARVVSACPHSTSPRAWGVTTRCAVPSSAGPASSHTAQWPPLLRGRGLHACTFLSTLFARVSSSQQYRTMACHPALWLWGSLPGWAWPSSGAGRTSLGWSHGLCHGDPLMLVVAVPN